MNDWEWNVLENQRPPDDLTIAGAKVRVGDRVRLRPRRRADILDMALQGKTAVIESIEQDYEGNVHMCVVADDDPGRDIGLARQPGHRFFFFPDEMEPLIEEKHSSEFPARSAPAVLVAGIGNIFMGDDGFGVEVVRRLSSRRLPVEAQVIDFGISGLDLAYALMNVPGTTILIDACPRGGAPGTLYLIEPDLSSLDRAGSAQVMLDAHAQDPLTALRLAKSMGAKLSRIVLLGCEPATLGPEEGQMGLSAAVEAALEDAANLAEALVRRVLDGKWPLVTLENLNLERNFNADRKPQ